MLKTYYVASEALLVGAKQQARVSLPPAAGFSPRSLMFPPDVVLNFQVTGLRVGKRNQMISPGSAPASLFHNKNGVREFDFDVVGPGEAVVLEVLNTSGDDLLFRTTLSGVVGGEGFPQHSHHRRSFVGFDLTMVAAGKRADVVVAAGEHFRADELHVAGEIGEMGEHFLVEQVMVGLTPQITYLGQSPTPIPAAVFSTNTPTLRFDTAVKNLNMTVTVVNISREDRLFTGAFVGRSLLAGAQS